MAGQNIALWLPKRGARFEEGPAPHTPPAANEVVVRVRAVAVNPVDAIPGYLYRAVVPWLSSRPSSAPMSPARSSRSAQA